MSSLQLNAKCIEPSVTGQIHYINNNYGTVLPPGTYELVATFTPDKNMEVYCVSTVSVILEVKEKNLVDVNAVNIDFEVVVIASERTNKNNNKTEGAYEDKLANSLRHFHCTAWIDNNNKNNKVKWERRPAKSEGSVDGSYCNNNNKNTFFYIPSLRWDPPENIFVGQPLLLSMLCARCEDAIEGSFSYNKNYGTLLGVGRHQLIATFTPINNNNNKKQYQSARISVFLTVRPKRVVVVVWDNPSSIPFGLLLSSTQLNAVCVDEEANSDNAVVIVKGSYRYNYNKGTLLRPGKHQLMVTFTPDNNNNNNNSIIYADATAKVTLRVYRDWLLLSRDYCCCLFLLYPKIEPAVSVLPSYTDKDTLLLLLTSKQTEGSSDDKSVNNINIRPRIYQHLETINENNNNIYKCLKRETTAKTEGSYDDNSCIVVIAKLTPLIEWKTPNNIYYGKLLSSVQLNAICTNDKIKGQLMFLPDSGTLLKPGRHWLRVEFVPVDKKMFNNNNSAVRITVKRRWSRPHRTTVAYDNNSKNNKDMIVSGIIRERRVQVDGSYNDNNNNKNKDLNSLKGSVVETSCCFNDREVWIRERYLIIITIAITILMMNK